MPARSWRERWKDRAQGLKRDIAVLSIAARDPRTPLWLKLIGGLLVAYAFSPIDLIPDFIPVLGLLDDLIILPLGIWFVLRQMPPELHAEFRDRAETAQPRGQWIVATAIVLIWVASAIAAYFLLRSSA
ncbi:YkvA family protein [Parasphingopyxis marina]|uniref:DUF1232 domain-containing protein n=1 Tax=Parasphingopyxis marina TaxID=2761622 RepID=A0A842I216_9SPHN|nr:DUF1232 domain-containing protein [Parasphingopyxis marina]MBC2778739.1 DUF1232 domain-containing protein [Parasphingopyxis marina]